MAVGGGESGSQLASGIAGGWPLPMGPRLQRRRERRLRSWYRHEQQTVRMALATFTHHSALRGQKTARAGEEDNEMHFTATFRANPPPQAAGTQYFAMDVDDVPAAGGSRPDRLLDVSGPQERVQRRTVEQLVDSPPVVPSLDSPVPLMAEPLVDVPFLVAMYEKRLEDLILTGAPVSAAEREAWRRWVNRSSSFLRCKEEEKEEEEETLFADS